MRRFLQSAVAILLTGLSAAAAAPAASAGIGGPLLPAQLAGWQRSDRTQASSESLEKVAGDTAAILREYGAQEAEQADYRRAEARWQVSVYRMQDRSGAYGAFTLLRADGAPLSLGEAGARAKDQIVFYQGDYFVQAAAGADTAALAELAGLLEAHAGRQASLPTLALYLPHQGLLSSSERYLLGPQALARVAPLALGDWVGFAYGAEVESARYGTAGTGETLLLLISYPTPQIAVARLRDFHRLFNLNDKGDPQRPRVYVRRLGTLVGLVADAPTSQRATALLDGINYSTEVSWSDSSPPGPQLSWTLTLLNIFLGTAALVVFVLLSAVGYGLLRLLIKRMLPGRVFDRGEEGDVIMLNITHPRK